MDRWPGEDPTPASVGPRPTGRWFHAVRPGTCVVCHTRYTPGTPVRMYIPAGWIASVIGAVVLLFVVGLARGGRHHRAL